MKTKINIKQIVIVVVVVVLFAFMVFSIYLQFSQYQKTNEAIENERNIIATAQINLEKLEELRDNEDIMLEQIRRLDAAIPPSPDEYGTIFLLHDSLVFPHSELIDIRFAPKISQDTYNEMPLRVTYEGHYGGLLAFMDNVSNSSRVFRIDDVKISRGSDGFPQLKAEMAVKAFYGN